MSVTRGKKQQINDNPVINADTAGKYSNKIKVISQNNKQAAIQLLLTGSDSLKIFCLELALYNKQQASQAGIKLKNIVLTTTHYK
jgi:hypothetical protein